MVMGLIIGRRITAAQPRPVVRRCETIWTRQDDNSSEKVQNVRRDCSARRLTIALAAVRPTRTHRTSARWASRLSAAVPTRALRTLERRVGKTLIAGRPRLLMGPTEFLVGQRCRFGRISGCTRPPPAASIRQLSGDPTSAEFSHRTRCSTQSHSRTPQPSLFARGRLSARSSSPPEECDRLVCPDSETRRPTLDVAVSELLLLIAPKITEASIAGATVRIDKLLRPPSDAGQHRWAWSPVRPYRRFALPFEPLAIFFVEVKHDKRRRRVHPVAFSNVSR